MEKQLLNLRLGGICGKLNQAAKIFFLIFFRKTRAEDNDLDALGRSLCSECAGHCAGWIVCQKRLPRE